MTANGYVRFEVLTVMKVRIVVLWGMVPYSLVGWYRLVAAIFCLRFQHRFVAVISSGTALPTLTTARGIVIRQMTASGRNYLLLILKSKGKMFHVHAMKARGGVEV
jgi:hypothetical protein